MSTDPTQPPRRSASTWAILVVVWVVGLLVWLAYIAMIVVAVVRLLS